MYTIEPKVFQGILNKKFNALVGNLCEKLETHAHEIGIAIESKEIRNLIKEVKKESYDTMRDIEGQVDAFSKGVNIHVTLIRPNSK